MNLYKQYNDKFIFMITDSQEVEDIFHHINKLAPSLSVFNFFKYVNINDLFGNYYKELVTPYYKKFINIDISNSKNIPMI